MSSIPSNLARVPTALSSKILLSNLTETSSQLLNTQVQMATGLLINRPSDDIVGASLVSLLEEQMERREQRLRTLDYADSMLGTMEHSLSEANDLLLESKSIAMTMLGGTIDSDTRRNQATVINSLLDEFLRIGNHELQGIHHFGGSQSNIPPFEELLGGYRYTGNDDTFDVNIGRVKGLPITASGHDVFGAMSARVVGSVDLDPALDGDVRLSDLAGARGLGISTGIMEIETNGSGSFNVDLTQADSIQDVVDMIADQIATFESDEGVTLLGAGGVTLDSANGRLNIDVAAGVTLTIADIGSDSTAADLGLDTADFTILNAAGVDLNPVLTSLTQLSDLTGVAGALGDFSIQNAGQVRIIDAGAAETVQDLQNLVTEANIGVRLEIAEDGKRLAIVNELSGTQMSVYESGGGDTASRLGLRSFSQETRLSDFNQGRGVQILSGQVDPLTGLPDPLLDRDFEIFLHDGSSFAVDIAGAETVGDVLDMINAASPPGLTASIGGGPNGIILTDTTGGTGSLSVTAINGSYAAQDLGLSGSTDSAVFTGEDRAEVEVDGLFTHMVALRDALEQDDSSGITFAAEKFEEDIDRIAQVRAIVGQRMNRISSIRIREEDEQLLDLSLKSQTQDLDFTEASIRFTTLQTQLQAAMITGSQANSLSLIQFLR